MSAQVELTNPVDLSVGGMRGHVFRRSIHVGMAIVPWAYFSHGEAVANAASLSLPQLVAALMLALLCAEAIRLRLGITIFGQRDYEATQLSALMWGSISLGFVFLLVPDEAYAWPLVLSLALGDPLMGEMRRKGWNDRKVMMAATGFLIIIWLLCSWQFGTPMWMAFVLAPIAMISEWPRLTYIDDNATMLLIPLAFILMFEPFAQIM